MTITKEMLAGFRASLVEGEMAQNTVTRYLSAVKAFAEWLGERPLAKEALLAWRDGLQRNPATVNVAVAAVNRLLAFLGRRELCLRHIKVQKKVFRAQGKELTRAEYERLISTAERQGRTRLARMIETICALGIRVSELRFITVESLTEREATIRNKGKTRTILLTAELVKKLRGYCRAAGIDTGPVFVTRSGRAVCRSQIWTEMKSICRAADVEESKVFPHNLRHLFAVVHYRLHKDIVRLADLLGHSSVNTTRIYLMTSGEEHQRELDAMGLVLAAANKKDRMFILFQGI